MRQQTVKQQFAGTVTAVKGRIRLLRSFDQVHHVYQGCTLVLHGTLDGQPAEELRIGDEVTGLAAPVADPHAYWATHYEVSKFRVPSWEAVPIARSPTGDGLGR